MQRATFVTFAKTMQLAASQQMPPHRLFTTITSDIAAVIQSCREFSANPSQPPTPRARDRCGIIANAANPAGITFA
jgi:hypothetical protein